jgi:glycosyltransferase involved in cell wall biosynthesis
MKVSVITVTRNAEQVISACLESVSSQTFADVEHIIIDGRSSDKTLEIIGKCSYPKTVVSEPDSGIFNAMNKGLLHARGEWIIFLNADDLFASRDALSDAIRVIESAPAVDVVYGDLHLRHNTGETGVFVPPGPENALDFLVTGCLPHQSTLARRSVFTLTCGFDERYQYQADYDWFLKVIIDPRIRVSKIDSCIGSFFTGGTSSRLEPVLSEVYEIQDRNPAFAGANWTRRRLELYQKQIVTLRTNEDVYRLACDELRAAQQKKRSLLFRKMSKGRL